MKKLLLKTSVLAVVLLLFVNGVTKAQSNHTVTLSGSSGDFNAAEKFTAGANSTDYYVTFDQTYMYIGAFRTSGTFGATDNLAIYIDTDPNATATSGAGSTTGFAYNGVTGSLPFSANYTVHIEQSYQEIRAYSGSWGSANTGITVFTSTTAREYKVDLSTIGSPKALNLTMWMGFANGFFSNVPGTNIGSGTNPTIVSYFGTFGVKNGTQGGVTPKDIVTQPATDYLNATSGTIAAGTYANIDIAGATGLAGNVTLAPGAVVNITSTGFNLAANAITNTAITNNLTSTQLNVAANATISRNAASALTVNTINTTGGTLTVTSAVATASAIVATNFNVKTGSIFQNNAGLATALAVTNFNVNNGGTYNHNAIGSGTNGASTDFPGSSTIVCGATSIVEIQTWGVSSGSAPAALPTIASPGWGTLSLNWGTVGGSVQMGGALTAIQGDFNVKSTGGTTREIRLSGNSTVFTLAVGGSINVSGGILNPTNGSGTPTINVAGDFNITGTGSVLLTQSSSSVTVINVNGTAGGTTGKLKINSSSVNAMLGSSSGNTTITTKGDFELTAGVFQFQNSSSSSKTYALNIGGNFNMTGGTFIGGSGSSQALVTFTGGTTAVTYTQSAGTYTNTNTNYTIANTPSGKTLTLNSNFAIQTGTTLTVTGALDCITNNVTGAGAFTLNSAATLKIGSALGITSTAASGSIQVTGTRTYSTGANYLYNGNVNQVTGDQLPATVNTLSINNTGTTNKTVSLTRTGITAIAQATNPSLILTAGLLKIQNSTDSISIASGGGISATSGDFSSASVGGIKFLGTGTVAGTVNFYPGVQQSPGASALGVNYGTGSTIQSSLVLNLNSFVQTNPPTYATGSTLYYNTGNSFTAATEWTGNATSGAGVPYNVTLGNGLASSSLNFAASTAYRQLNGNLTLSSTSTLALSSASGGDIKLAGNWTNNGGTFTPNARAVFFIGATGNQTVTKSTGETFDYVIINKATSGNVVLANAATINQTLTLTNGLLDIGNNNLSFGGSGTTASASAASYIATTGSGKVIKSIASPSGTFLFPIGRSTTTTQYSPLTISSPASTSTYTVGAAATSYSPSNDGANAQWSISSSASTTANLDFQWLTADAGANLLAAPTTGRVHQYNGSTWDNRGGSTSGTPNVSSVTGVTTASTNLIWTVAIPLAVPDIALADNVSGQVASSTVTAPTNTKIIYNFQTTITTATAVLNQLTFATTNSASDVTKYQLYFSDNVNTFGSQIGSDITTSLGTGTHTFSGLTASVASGRVGYFWITADVPSGATPGNTIVVTALTTSNLTYNAGGNKTGSASTGGTITVIKAPTVTTGSATNITTTDADLAGTVNANASTTTGNIQFQYGTTNSYGTNVTASPSSASGTGNTSVAATAFSGGTLTPNTLYHYRVTATNIVGTTNGSDATFTTVSNPPSISSGNNTSAAGTAGPTTFTAYWSAPASQGSETFTYTIEVDDDNAFGTPVSLVGATGISSGTFTYNVTGLTSGVAYYYRVKAVNVSGTQSSAWSSPISDPVTTTSSVAPSVSTGTVTSSSIVVDGAQVAGNNVTSDGGATISARGLIYNTSSPAETGGTAVSTTGTTGSYDQTLTGLSANTLYYVKAYATNIVGTTYATGEVSFTTLATEPTTASTVTFGTRTNTSLVVNFSGGDGGKRFVVARAANNTFSFTPSDRTPLGGTISSVFTTASDQGGGDKIVYDGTGSTVTVTGLTANTVYYFKVYEYTNNSATPTASPNYYLTPGTGNQTTYNPTITVTGTLSGFGNVVTGSNSTSQSYTVAGTELASSITVTAPTGFSISLDDIDYSANPIFLAKDGSDAVTTTTIYARFSPSSADGLHSGVNITHTATDATTRNVAVSGTAIAASPTTQGSITFGTVTATSIVLNLPTVGDGTNRIIVAKSGSAPTDPSDGTAYTANAAFGSGNTTAAGSYVVYNGSGSGSSVVTVTGLTSGTTYYFAVYEFNVGTNTSQNYLTPSTATGNQATTAASSNTDYFRSVATGNWNATSTWESSSNNSTWIAATLAPDVNANLITIRSGNTVTVSTGTVTVDQLTVNNGGILAIASGATLSIAAGAGTDLTVDAPSGTPGYPGDQSVPGGIVQISAGGAFASAASTTMTVSGTFDDQTSFASGTPYTFTAGSGAMTVNGTFKISGLNSANNQQIGTLTGVTFTAPSLPGTLGGTLYIASGVPRIPNANAGNVTWNVSSASANSILNNATVAITGDFTIVATGGVIINNGSGGTARTLTVSGSLNMIGGTYHFGLTGSTAAQNVTVNGNVNISGGTLLMTNATGGSSLLTVKGNVNHTAGTFGNGTSVTVGTLSMASTTADQTISTTGFSNQVNLTVNNTKSSGLVTLNSSATVGTLTLTAGTLTVGANTLTLTGTAITTGGGSINASNGSATVVLAAAAAQTVTGAVFTGNVTNLTINNSAGVSLGASTAITISGTLTFTSGKLDIATNTLTIGASGSISGASSSNYIITSGAGLLKRTSVGNTATSFPVGNSSTSYTPLTITNTGTSNDISVSSSASITNAVIFPLKVVTLQWTITTGGAGTVGTIVYNWNSGNQGGSFSNSSAGELGVYSGSGPYAITSLGTLSGTSVTATGIALASGSNLTVIGNTNAIYVPVIIGWDMSTQTGGANNFGASPLAPSFTATNITGGNLVRGAGVTQSGTGASRGFGGTGLNNTTSAAAISASAFFTFTVKPNTGFSTSLTTINPFGYRTSGTGPANILIQYSINGGTYTDILSTTLTLNTSTGALGPIDLSGITALQSIQSTSTVTFRIVPYNASSSTGTFYIYDVANSTANDIAINGTVNSCSSTSATPVVNNICTNTTTTTVSGTSSEANGTIVEVYVNGAFTVPATTATVSSGTWSATLASSITAGNTVTAYAFASGKCVSTVSSTVTVKTIATAPVVTGTYCPGGTSVAGTSSEASGSTIEVFVNGVSAGTTTVSSGTWAKTVSALSAADVLTATVLPTTKCVSAVSSGVTVQSNSDAPVITGAYCATSTSVSGTSTEANGTIIEVFINGSTAGTTTVTGGVWTKTGLTLAASNALTAKATASGECISAASSTVTVQVNSDAPVVDAACAGSTTVTGTSTEANGTTIEVFVNGVTAGTTTVSSGVWSKTVSAVSSGNTIYATALASGECTSANSSTVTVSATSTANAGTDQSICDGSGATLAASGTGTGAWTVVSGPSTSTAQFDNTASATAIFTPGAGVGTYTLRWTVTSSPCSAATDDVVITVRTTGQWVGPNGGDWSNAANWCGGVPTAGSSVTIPSGVTIDINSTSVSITNITIDAGGSLVMTSTGNLNIQSGGSITNNGTFDATASTGSVVFAGSGSVSGTITFNNVDISGGVDFGSGSTIGSGGTLSINPGGYVNTNAPTYNCASTLKYNTGGTYGRGSEWTATSGAGYPGNVQVSSNTTINLPNGNNTDRFICGDLIVDAGSAVYADYGGGSVQLTIGDDLVLNGSLSAGGSSGDDIRLGGDWTRGSSSSINYNGRAVFFNGSADQVITLSAGGTESFPYLIVDKSVGNVKLGTSTDVTLSTTSGDPLQIINAGGIDLNGRTLTLSGNGGNILASGGARTIGGTGTLAITGTKTVTSASGGTLSFGSGVTILATSGINFGSGLSTVNGILQINVGGYVDTNAPTYDAASTLIYNASTYGRSTEWSATSGAGYPGNVTIGNGVNTAFDLSANGSADRKLAGTLSIAAGSSLSMGSMTNKLTVVGNVSIAGTLTLSSAANGNIEVGGNWTRSSGGTFTNNSRNVTFNGSTTSSITAPASSTRDGNGARGGETFYNVYMSKSNTTDQVNLASNITVTNEIGFVKGAFDCGVGDVTIVSNATKTAHVAEISNVSDVSLNYSDTGKFIIQRYLPMEPFAGSRRWRLMTAPINSSSTNDITISRAWQEGAANSVTTAPIDPQPGFGMVITNGNTSAAVANGFDIGTTTSPSIYYLAPGVSPTWTPPATTNAFDIADQQGYMVFVRGDRSRIVSNQFIAPVPTTLEPKGRINIGQVTVPLVTGKQVVGNPYAAALNFNKVLLNGDDPSTTTGLGYALWDPKSPGAYQVGQWVVFSSNGDGTYNADPSTNVSGLPLDGTIESGSAFLIDVPADGSIVMNEDAKLTTSSTVGIASRPIGNRPVSAPIAKISTNMYLKNTDGTTSLMDGVSVLYDPSYHDVVDIQDALKISTFTSRERISIVRNGKMLSTERRMTMDTVYLSVNKMNTDPHQLQLSASNFDVSAVAFLEDKFLNTLTPLDLTGVTSYDYSITADVASSDTSRFRIIFKPLNTTPLKFTSVKAAQQQTGGIAVQWQVETEVNAKTYEVEKSKDGIHFTKVTTVAATNNGVMGSYNWLDNVPNTGDNYYRVRLVAQNGSVIYSQIVKVVTGNIVAEIGVYPNPIVDGVVGLQLINMPKGNYTVRIINTVGQTILKKTVQHVGGSSTETLSLGNNIAKGVYMLEIIHPDLKKTVINLAY